MTRFVRCLRDHRTHSDTGMLPSAMPAASLSSSVAKRYKPAYRSQSALISSLVQVSNNCLKLSIRSASDHRSASSPPPSARTCVTCVSIITASRVCCAVNGIEPYLLALREGSRTTGPIMTQLVARDEGVSQVWICSFTCPQSRGLLNKDTMRHWCSKPRLSRSSNNGKPCGQEAKLPLYQ